MPSLRDLLDLAADGQPADFTDFVRDFLDNKADNATAQLAGLSEEDEDEELEIDVDEDELDELDLEDEIDDEIDEAHTMKREPEDDMKSKGRAKKQAARQMRRGWKRPKWDDDMDEGVTLREDLSEDEIEEIIDVITEEDFESLSEASKEMLFSFLDERNKVNAELGRAWKAGQRKKLSPNPSKTYMSSRDKRDEKWNPAAKEKRLARDAAAAETHHKKTDGRVEVSKYRRRKMGAPVRKASHARDAGKAHEPKMDTGNANYNARAKERDADPKWGSGLGRGKHLQQHHEKQHDKIRRSAEQMHNELQRHLSGLRDTATHHSFGSKDTGPAAIAAAKAAHDKMARIHSQITAEGVEFEDDFLDVIEAALIEAQEALGESQLDELSRKTLGSYVRKASVQASRASEKGGRDREKASALAWHASGDRDAGKAVDKLHGDVQRADTFTRKRLMGVSDATRRLSKD